MSNQEPTLAGADPGELPPASVAGDTASVRYPNPIGVPQYSIDQSTGQVATDDQGNAVPWYGAKEVPYAKALFGGYDDTETQFYGAQYMDGDEWAVIGNMPPELRAEVQQAMLDRGLFGAKKPNVAMGSWDSESAGAFKQVLAYANASGQDWQEALREMPVVDPEGLGGTTEVERNHYNIQLSNPADLEQVFKRAAADLLGGSDVPQEEIDKFVRAYQSNERAEQEAQIAAQEAAKRDTQSVTVGPDGKPVQTPVDQDLGIGALPDSAAMAVADTSNDPITTTTTKAADPSTLAQQMLKEQYGGRVGATALAGQFDSFLSILGGMNSGGSTQGRVV